jgi:hypothetical protein
MSFDLHEWEVTRLSGPEALAASCQIRVQLRLADEDPRSILVARQAPRRK